MTRWHILYGFLVVASSMGAVAVALCMCESLLKRRYQRQHPRGVTSPGPSGNAAPRPQAQPAHTATPYPALAPVRARRRQEREQEDTPC